MNIEVMEYIAIKENDSDFVGKELCIVEDNWERMLDGVMYSSITVQHLEVFSFNELTNTLFNLI